MLTFHDSEDLGGWDANCTFLPWTCRRSLTDLILPSLTNFQTVGLPTFGEFGDFGDLWEPFLDGHSDNKSETNRMDGKPF